VTAAVLLAMDLLECFLHALRLHWVRYSSRKASH
jgi:vacuolar-type H+-ATPase subunit I/STV1